MDTGGRAEEAKQRVQSAGEEEEEEEGAEEVAGAWGPREFGSVSAGLTPQQSRKPARCVHVKASVRPRGQVMIGHGVCTSILGSGRWGSAQNLGWGIPQHKPEIANESGNIGPLLTSF